MLEDDSLIIVQASCENSPAPSSVAPLIYGVLATSYDFDNVTFSHVCRQDNKPAHLLAKPALGINDFSVWIE